MKNIFKKTILFALVAALGVASLPVFSVAAAAAGNDPTPPPPTAQITNERLEKIWAREQRVYNRLGRIDQVIDRVQTLIDRATANGKDASGVQAALDVFKVAWKNAKPIYEGMNGIVTSHQGFDNAGRVTDPAKAKETVQDMRDKFQEIKTAMNGTGQALRNAIKAFRAANPRPWQTATPAP
jgi:hypothetical protein